MRSINNTVVVGSIVIWMLLFAPLYFGARAAVRRYRSTYGERGSTAVSSVGASGHGSTTSVSAAIEAAVVSGMGTSG